MSDWLVFDTEAQALSAIDSIDTQLGLPIKGRNQETDEVDETAVGTETWAIPVQRLDGRWVFARCPDADPDEPFVAEAYDPLWFPQEET